MNDPVNSAVFEDLQRQINALNTRLAETTQKTARAETVGGFQSFAYADRPQLATGGMQTDNTQYADMGFCYDCRKSGEGVGAGTGVPCFFSPTDDDWRRFEDNAIVTN